MLAFSFNRCIVSNISIIVYSNVIIIFINITQLSDCSSYASRTPMCAHPFSVLLELDIIFYVNGNGVRLITNAHHFSILIGTMCLPFEYSFSTSYDMESTYTCICRMQYVKESHDISEDSSTIK